MTLGEKLRKLRSDRRVALNEVSRVTQIQIKYLEALEDGAYDRLPADVYVKGFLRSYADFFGVDEAILVKLYEKEKGIKRNLEKSRNGGREDNYREPLNISSFVFTPKKITAVIASFLVLAGFFYLYRELGSFSDAPRLVILSPENNAQIDSNSTTIEGITDTDARLFINGQPILIGDDGKFKETITMQKGVNVIQVKSVNKFDKEAAESISVVANYEEKTDDNSGNNASNSQDISHNTEGKEIQMEVRVDPGPVWLSVEADGNLVFSGTMLTGATQSFKAHDGFVVSSGKANVTFVKFNGKDIGPLATDPGAVRGVTFNRDTKY